MGKLVARLIANYVQAETDDDRDRAENTLHKLGVSDINPTTMSRVTGEFVVEAGGKPQRYRYTVRSQYVTKRFVTMLVSRSSCRRSAPTPNPPPPPDPAHPTWRGKAPRRRRLRVTAG